MNMKSLLLSSTSLIWSSIVVVNGQDNASSLLDSLSSDAPNGIHGHPLCPCVDTVFDDLDPREISNLTQQLGIKNIEGYGIGCRPHDEGTIPCANTLDDGCSVDPNFLTSSDTRPACDKSYCRRSWCYVDPNHCEKLVRTVSPILPHSKIWYSYATCGELDSFTNTTRLNALRGSTLRVGFNRNSGGWTGSYSTKNIHFEGPGSAWYGPAVEFVREAARIGGFNVNITPPLAELKNKTVEYFSTSPFDHCEYLILSMCIYFYDSIHSLLKSITGVYSTALGYNDFCVAKYTVTDKRAVTADWFVLDNNVSLSCSYFIILYLHQLKPGRTPSLSYFSQCTW